MGFSVGQSYTKAFHVATAVRTWSSTSRPPSHTAIVNRIPSRRLTRTPSPRALIEEYYSSSITLFHKAAACLHQWVLLPTLRNITISLRQQVDHVPLPWTLPPMHTLQNNYFEVSRSVSSNPYVGTGKPTISKLTQHENNIISGIQQAKADVVLHTDG